MTRHCAISVAPTCQGFVVRVQGSGTSTHSPTLATFVNECFGRDVETNVAIDLIGCDYLDSTFLGCLVKLQRAGTKTRFQVVADEASRKRLLAATQLDGYFAFDGEAPKSTSPFVKLDISPLSDHELGQHVMEAHQALGDVPSEFASKFKRIASQLMSELARQNPDSGDMADTVIVPIRGRKP
jgi:anti-anti-sigma factor